MEKVDKNEKIVFFEFFGLPGSGKTTICTLLEEQFKKNGIKITTRKKLNEKRIFKIILLYPIKTFKIALCCFRNRYFFYNPNCHKSFFKRNYSILKIMIKNFGNYSLLKKGSRVVLLDESIFQYIIFSLNLKINLKKIFKIYPSSRIILVFVDTPYEIAYQRNKKRKHFWDFKDIIKNRNEKEGILFYKKMYHCYKNLYQILLEKEDKDKKIIRIDGNMSIEKNAELIKDIKL